MKKSKKEKQYIIENLKVEFDKETEKIMIKSEKELYKNLGFGMSYKGEAYGIIREEGLIVYSRKVKKYFEKFFNEGIKYQLNNQKVKRGIKKK